MGMDTIKFDKKIVKKYNFYRGKTKLFEIEDIDLDKIKVSVQEGNDKKKGSYKYFIGYDDNGEIVPLVIDLSQMIGYYKIHKDDNKTMNFVCNDKDLLKEYKKIWEKVSSIKNK